LRFLSIVGDRWCLSDPGAPRIQHGRLGSRLAIPFARSGESWRDSGSLGPLGRAGPRPPPGPGSPTSASRSWTVDLHRGQAGRPWKGDCMRKLVVLALLVTASLLAAAPAM